MQVIRPGAEHLYLLNILLVLESGSQVVLDQSDPGRNGQGTNHLASTQNQSPQGLISLAQPDCLWRIWERPWVMLTGVKSRAADSPGRERYQRPWVDKDVLSWPYLGSPPCPAPSTDSLGRRRNSVSKLLNCAASHWKSYLPHAGRSQSAEGTCGTTACGLPKILLLPQMVRGCSGLEPSTTSLTPVSRSYCNPKSF